MPGGRRRTVYRPPTARRMVAAMLGAALTALWLVPLPAAAQAQAQAKQAQEQVLTWTAGNSVSEYVSAPTTATAGPATLVFENSTETGNTMGMSHTLTFDVSKPGYNHDVDVDILANPFDSNGGRYEVQVDLTPGTYYYFCKINGHTMSGELVVTDDGGGDTTAPQVSGNVSGKQDPDGNYVGSATVTVSANDSESGVDSVEYEIDDTGFQPYSGPVTVDDPGEHSVQYRATDAAGNVSQVGSVSFTVVESAPEDTTAPDVSASVSGDRNTDGAYVGSATVTVSASDSESGVATVEYALGGASYTQYSGPVTVNQPGEHTVSYRATDTAGNTSTPKTVTFTVAEPAPEDTTAPQTSATVSGNQDTDGNYVESATVTVSAQDGGSGVDSVEYALDGQPFAAYSGPVTVNQPGEHTVQYRATDTAGNTSTPKTVTFTVVEPAPEDTTAPQVSASVSGDQDADGNYVGAATVTVSASDSESGVATVEYALDGASYTQYSGPVTVNQPGEHTVQYRATDTAGNTSTPKTVTFTVAEPAPEDTTAPQTSATVSGKQDTDGNYVESATVTVSAQDAQSGLADIEYSVDGDPYALYTGPIVVNQLGEHTVSYRATDTAGNTSTPKSVTFTVAEPAPEDSCPDSDTRDTVIVGDEDTGVDNANTGDGCTINDLIAEDATYANHGAFVSHVNRVTNELMAADVISGKEKGRIMRAAGRSDIGR
ncbi:OmpL47-type beta-barrel domain-containing protein [Halopolyspora algeriensis]